MATQITNAELSALIRETQNQLKDLLKSEEYAAPAAPMMAKDEKSDKDSKSDAPPPEKKDDSKSAPPPPPAADSASAPPESAPPAADSAAPAPADASAPSADPSADPAAAPADAAGSAGGDSVDTLIAAYSQLAAQPNGPEMLRAHFMALKQVIAQSMASASAAPMPPAPMAPPAASAPAAPPADAALPMANDAADLAMKHDKELLEKLNKSESEVDDLKKKVETLTKGLELVLRKPERKGITGRDYAGMVKSEPPPAVDPTKLKDADLRKALAQKAANPDLKKSERELINGWFNRKVKTADLAPLFDTNKK